MGTFRRNNDWSKEYFIRQKAEALEYLYSELESVTATVEATESTLEELQEKTEEYIKDMVETEAQKEFMRYAFLEEPKTQLGKLVSGAKRSSRPGGMKNTDQRLKRKFEYYILSSKQNLCIKQAGLFRAEKIYL